MRILLIDDHTLFREALLHVLRQFDSTAVVIEAATAREAIRLAAHYHDLDLILLDLNLPGLNGLCALPELHELRPTVPLIILSASEDALNVRQALAAGGGWLQAWSGVADHALVLPVGICKSCMEARLALPDFHTISARGVFVSMVSGAGPEGGRARV